MTRDLRWGSSSHVLFPLLLIHPAAKQKRCETVRMSLISCTQKKSYFITSWLNSILGDKTEVVLDLLIFVPIHGASIAFLIALQWKCENLLGEKQPKFTDTSTIQSKTQYTCNVLVERPLNTARSSSGWNCNPAAMAKKLRYVPLCSCDNVWKSRDVWRHFKPSTKPSSMFFGKYAWCPEFRYI